MAGPAVSNKPNVVQRRVFTAHPTLDNLRICRSSDGTIFFVIVETGGSVPTDALTGFAPSCMLLDLTATSFEDRWLVNNGDETSCNFDSALTGGTDLDITLDDIIADSLTGADAQLDIAGKAGAAGGAGGQIVSQGGTGHTNGAGGANAVVGGTAAGTGTGGNATLQGGTSGGALGTAGNANVDAGDPSGGTAGVVLIGTVHASEVEIGKSGGTVTIHGSVVGGTSTLSVAGKPGESGGAGGAVSIAAGTGDGVSAGGQLNLASGSGDAAGASDGGNILVLAGASGGGATGNGGTISVQAGAAASTNGNGGLTSVAGGASAGTGVGGDVDIHGGAGSAGGTAGGILIEAGDPNGGTPSLVRIGTVNDATVNIGKAGNQVNIKAPLGDVLEVGDNGVRGVGITSLLLAGQNATGSAGLPVLVQGGSVLDNSAFSGGSATVTGGDSGGALGTAGSASVDAGAASGGTAGSVSIGAANALDVNLGRAAGRVGFYGVTAVVKGAALTAADAGAINSGDGGTDTVIANMRTRINELEARLGSATGVGLFA